MTGVFVFAMKIRQITLDEFAIPCHTSSHADRSNNTAELTALADSTMTGAVIRSIRPSRSYSTAFTRLPSLVRISSVALELVLRVSLPVAKAGLIAATSASVFAWTLQGKPSQVLQRTHGP